MRTKHLLTAIVLPSLFAACTADELVKTDNGAAEDLSKRPVVEGVTLNLGGADTKAIVPEGGNFNTIQYESTDKVGALLIDQLDNYDEDAPIGSYKLMANKFNTNYEFKNVGGANFASEAYLVEGNYVFYYPYNGQRTRGEMLTNLPKTQKLAKDANGNWSTLPDVIAKSEELGAPIAIGYDFIASSDEDKTAKADMKQIYAVPQFTIQNYYTVEETVNGQTVDVEKAFKIQEIELSYGTETRKDFTLSAPLKFATENNTAWTEAKNTTGTKSIVKVLFNEELPVNADSRHYSSSGWWLEPKPYAERVRATSDVIGSAESDGKSKKITITLDKPVEVAYGETFTFYAVIPAESYTEENKLNVTVVNSEGYSETKTLGEATLYPARRYPIEEYAEGNPNVDLAGSALTASIEGFNDLAGVRVSTVDELINTIKNYNASTPGVLKIVTAGTAVIDKRVAQFLNATTTKATGISFESNVDFEGTGVSLTPKKPVTFNEGATVKEGANVTINQSETVNVVLSDKQKLTVVAGGTLTLKANTFDAGSVVENSGTLNVTGTQSAKVTNYGTMNVVGNATLSAKFNNGKSDGRKAAELNIVKDKTLNVNGTNSVNHLGATINNLGVLDGETNLTNNGTINNGAANNSTAVAEVNTNATSSETGAAAATINNYAVLTVDNNAVVNMMSENANATVTGSGKVNNDVLAIVTNNEDNSVYYTMSGNCSEIPGYLGANNINTLVLKNCALSLAEESPYTTTVNMDVVVEGTTTIAGTTGAVAKQIVVIESGKTLTIEKEATLNVQATAGIDGGTGNGIVIENYGTVNNRGEVTNVNTYTEGTGAKWNYNPYEENEVNVSGAALTVSKARTYILSQENTVINGVTANGTITAEENVNAKMTVGVYNGINGGKLTVGEHVTLQIGAGTNTTDLLKIETAVDGVASASELQSSFENKKGNVFAALKTVCDPSAENAKVVATTGTLKAVFEFKMGEDTRYVIATWTGTGWEFGLSEVQTNLTE